MAVVQRLLQAMPFLFGLGFVAPLVAQVIARGQGHALVLGLSPSLLGLGLGGAWGLVANLRGRWL